VHTPSLPLFSTPQNKSSFRQKLAEIKKICSFLSRVNDELESHRSSFVSWTTTEKDDASIKILLKFFFFEDFGWKNRSGLAVKAAEIHSRDKKNL